MSEHQLSIDDAVAQFLATAGDMLADMPPGPSGGRAPQTLQEQEDAHFHMAEFIVARMCPDAGRCRERVCRRAQACKHRIEILNMRAKPPIGLHPRRTPGAHAARYAMWLYMNHRR